MPVDLEDVPAHGPAQNQRTGRADCTREQSQGRVLTGDHRGQRPGAGPERAQDRRLVDALELRHRDGADQDEDAAEQGNAADHRDRKRNVADHFLHGCQYLAYIDRRDVRISGDEIMLEGAAGGGILRRPGDADEAVWRGGERAGTKHEHETAGTRIFPGDLANAGDSRLDAPSENVEPHEIPDVDRKSGVDTLFYRHLEFRCINWLRLLAGPELSVDDCFVRFKMISIGDHVFACE